MPVDRDVLGFFALGNTLVTRICKHVGFFAVYQRAGLRHIVDVRCGARHAVHQARVGIHTNMGLHSEVPLTTRLRLMHLRVALAAAVLGRAGCGDQGCVYGRAALEQRALGSQRAVDGGQYLNAQLVLLEQVAKPQDAHTVRDALAARTAVDANEPDRLKPDVLTEVAHEGHLAAPYPINMVQCHSFSSFTSRQGEHYLVKSEGIPTTRTADGNVVRGRCATGVWRRLPSGELERVPQRAEACAHAAGPLLPDACEHVCRKTMTASLCAPPRPAHFAGQVLNIILR